MRYRRYMSVAEAAKRAHLGEEIKFVYNELKAADAEFGGFTGVSVTRLERVKAMLRSVFQTVTSTLSNPEDIDE